MRVLVCGGREYKDRKTLFRELDAIAPQPALIISGEAKGADRLAFEWSIARMVDYWGFNADWKLNGKGAGPIRNQRMIDEGKPDLVIAFPGGKGTADMVRRAKAAGIEVHEVSANPRPTTPPT